MIRFLRQVDHRQPLQVLHDKMPFQGKRGRTPGSPTVDQCKVLHLRVVEQPRHVGWRCEPNRQMFRPENGRRVVWSGKLDVFASVGDQRGDAAGRRVLAAGEVGKAVVGDISQIRSLLSHQHPQQDKEEKHRRADGGHHSWRRVSVHMLGGGRVQLQQCEWVVPEPADGRKGNHLLTGPH